MLSDSDDSPLQFSESGEPFLTDFDVSENEGSPSKSTHGVSNNKGSSSNSKSSAEGTTTMSPPFPTSSTSASTTPSLSSLQQVSLNSDAPDSTVRQEATEHMLTCQHRCCCASHCARVIRVNRAAQRDSQQKLHSRLQQLEAKYDSLRQDYVCLEQLVTSYRISRQREERELSQQDRSNFDFAPHANFNSHSNDRVGSDSFSSRRQWNSRGRGRGRGRHFSRNYGPVARSSSTRSARFSF